MSKYLHILENMGSIYKYTCTNCRKIKGEVLYGVGMSYPTTMEDTRLFGCDSCGKVFSGNINDIFILCPKCKEAAYELEFFERDEDGWGEGDRLEDPLCPNCKRGRIQLEHTGMWD